MAKKNITEIRKKPGESNAGKYPNVKAFAGPDKTFPINSEARGRNALARSHFAAHPAEIRKNVFAKYPGLKEGSKFYPKGKKKESK